MTVEVTREVMARMAGAARTAHPHEACGILLGENLSGPKPAQGGPQSHKTAITAFRQTANVHPDPASHFEIDPQALIDAYRAVRAGGLQVIGYFHSHPAGPARPSATDAAMAAGDGRIWAIAGSGDIALWRNAASGFMPLSYCVINA